ncbi:MAG: hypothetical protein Q8Q26_16725, partial [Pseudorhodobacter sp.]|nr:hypothetical protein [Pseudorhodobacter sp.]
MALLHEERVVKAAPFPVSSCNFDADGHPEGGERVEAADCASGFGFLAVDGAAFEVWADDGLEAEHRGLGPRALVIAGLLLSIPCALFLLCGGPRHRRSVAGG